VRARSLQQSSIDDAERLHVTLERAPFGIAHVDERGGWQLLNKRLSAILGIDRARLLSLRLATLLDLDFRRADRMPRDAASCTEQRYVRPDGGVVWLMVGLSSVRGDDGRARYYVITVEDISAAKAASGAIGAAAHELRLPLTHIKGFISTLRRSDIDWDARLRGEFLVDAEHEADRLEQLIHELLDESTGGSAARPRRTTIQPPALILTTVNRVRPMIGDRQVRVDVPAGVPPLRVEVPAMERVIANLLLNASKFSPPDSPIDVNVQIVGDFLELRVEDRGPGVPLSDYERIFEPFYRREVQSRKPEGEGSHGLGLAISRSIVVAHGGRIWVSERPGGGASFTVALPLVMDGMGRGRRARQDVRGCPAQSRHRWPGTSRSTTALTGRLD
jgi:PAS domain S-box-containing protein